MSFDLDEEPLVRPRSKRWLVILACVIAVVVVWVWREADPFFIYRPDMKASKALLDTATKRPLTDEEFEQALALLNTETKAAPTVRDRDHPGRRRSRAGPARAGDRSFGTAPGRRAAGRRHKSSLG